jgi:hypothetical protein
MRYLVLVLVVLFAGARENPFVPIDKSVVIGKATNEPSPIKQFENKPITLPDSARILKQVSVTFQNLDGTTQTISSDINKKVDWHAPLVLSQTLSTQMVATNAKSTAPAKKYKVSNFFSFEASKNLITLYTKDTMMRDFMVANPFKIVIDFESKLDFATISKKVDYANFVKVTLGNHEGYYRVVIELDGQYTYKLDNSGEGLKVQLY